MQAGLISKKRQPRLSKNHTAANMYTSQSTPKEKDLESLLIHLTSGWIHSVYAMAMALLSITSIFLSSLFFNVCDIAVAPLRTKSLSSLVELGTISLEISPIEANAMSSDSSRPFAGPRLHRSVPCFAKASLNFFICIITTIRWILQRHTNTHFNKSNRQITLGCHLPLH